MGRESIIASVIFLLVYAGLVVSKRYRWLIAWGGVAAALLISIFIEGVVLTPAEIVEGINWNVMGIFFGSLLLAEMFIYSRMPETISDILINRSPSLGKAFLLIVMFASVFSIFMDNVATVLIIAPIAIQLCRKAGVSPVPVVIGLAVASNLQGMAILIGDTPSMLLAAKSGMDFNDFFWYEGRPSIFWIVQLGAAAGFVVLYFFFRGRSERPVSVEVTPVRSWVPLWLIVIIIVLLFLLSLKEWPLPILNFRWSGGAVCMIVGAGGYIWFKIHSRPGNEKMLRKLDYSTVAFLMAIFALVHMLVERNVVRAIVDRMDILHGHNEFIIFSVIVWFSVLVSAFIDNIPYIAAMLPFVGELSTSLGINPTLMMFGVLVGSCMGGNITPIGAVANLVAVGILGKEGRHVSFGSFVRIGLPFTVVATGICWLVLWFIYN